MKQKTKLILVENPDPNPSHPYLLGTEDGQIVEECARFSVAWDADKPPMLNASFYLLDPRVRTTAELEALRNDKG